MLAALHIPPAAGYGYAPMRSSRPRLALIARARIAVSWAQTHDRYQLAAATLCATSLVGLAGWSLYATPRDRGSEAGWIAAPLDLVAPLADEMPTLDDAGAPIADSAENPGAEDATQPASLPPAETAVAAGEQAATRPRPVPLRPYAAPAASRAGEWPFPPSVQRWRPVVEVELAALRSWWRYHPAVTVELVLAIMTAESGGDALALSTADAVGLMQVLPSTFDEMLGVHPGARATWLLARSAGTDAGNPGEAGATQELAPVPDVQLPDPFDPSLNVRAGMRYLALALSQHEGDAAWALAAYNAGANKALRVKAGESELYDQTLNYVAHVLDLRDRALSYNGVAPSTPPLPTAGRATPILGPIAARTATAAAAAATTPTETPTPEPSPTATTTETATERVSAVASTTPTTVPSTTPIASGTAAPASPTSSPIPLTPAPAGNASTAPRQPAPTATPTAAVSANASPTRPGGPAPLISPTSTASAASAASPVPSAGAGTTRAQPTQRRGE